VRLASGQIGAIVVWHKAPAVVGIVVPGQRVLGDPCGQLSVDALGPVVEV